MGEISSGTDWASSVARHGAILRWKCPLALPTAAGAARRPQQPGTILKNFAHSCAIVCH